MLSCHMFKIFSLKQFMGARNRLPYVLSIVLVLSFISRLLNLEDK